MIASILTIALIAWLPGAILYRAPLADRARRAALPAEERTFWAIILSLIISSCVILGLAAVEQYSFDRLLAANAALSVLMLLAWNLRLRYGSDASPVRSAAVSAVTAAHAVTDVPHSHAPSASASSSAPARVLVTAS